MVHTEYVRCFQRYKAQGVGLRLKVKGGLTMTTTGLILLYKFELLLLATSYWLY